MVSNLNVNIHIDIWSGVMRSSPPLPPNGMGAGVCGQGFGIVP